MVNWRSDVNTPLRLNGRTMRSASTPSTGRDRRCRRVRLQRAEAHALGDEIGLDVLSACARLSHGRVALGLEVGGHFARQQFDEARAHQRDRMALAGEGGIGGVELRALETFGDESVGDGVAGAAEHGLVMATGAGIGVRPAEARERGIDAELALGGDDRLRRLRPSRAAAVVNLAWNSSRPRAIRPGMAEAPAAATASKSTWLVNTRSSQLPASTEPAVAVSASARAKPPKRFLIPRSLFLVRVGLS